MLYKKIYRIESSRLKEWDYSENGYYFVTICTKGKKCLFGKVNDGKMYLSEIGKMVAKEWKKTEKIRKNVKLDQWIIMPNHLHGIIIIRNNNVEAFWNNSNICTKNVANLSSIIRGFKSAVTKSVYNLGYSNFSWQSRFYDHIIRNEKYLLKIREYIINNTIKWELDEYNPKNS
jgi:REP element-mobilizing transposase RayT